MSPQAAWTEQPLLSTRPGLLSVYVSDNENMSAPRKERVCVCVRVLACPRVFVCHSVYVKEGRLAGRTGYFWPHSKTDRQLKISPSWQKSFTNQEEFRWCLLSKFLKIVHPPSNQHTDVDDGKERGDWMWHLSYLLVSLLTRGRLHPEFVCVCFCSCVCVFKRQNNGNRKNAGSNSYFFNSQFQWVSFGSI